MRERGEKDGGGERNGRGEGRKRRGFEYCTIANIFLLDNAALRSHSLSLSTELVTASSFGQPNI